MCKLHLKFEKNTTIQNKLTLDIRIIEFTTNLLMPGCTLSVKSLSLIYMDSSQRVNWLFRNFTKYIIAAHDGFGTPQYLHNIDNENMQHKRLV